MDILVVYNTHAGDSVGLTELRQAFRAAQTAKQIVFYALDATLKQQVQRAVHAGCKTIVAAGGDGTVNALVNTIMGQRLTFGVIPLGTLNHFAKDIHMPSDLSAAVQAILHGHTTKVDIVRAGERYVVNNASFGLYPRLVQARESHSSLLGKWPALLWAFINILPRLRRHHVTVWLDGKPQQYRALFVVISNNRYDRQSGFTARPSLTRGELSVYVLTAANVATLLRVGWRAFRGALWREPAFTSQTAHEVVLERRNKKPMLLAFDGEVDALKQSQLTCRVLPRALRVIVPAANVNFNKL